MATESGYQNQKKFGDGQFKTIQPVGSSKYGVNTAQMYLYDVTPAALSIVTSANDDVDPRKIYVEITGHGARVGDVLRIQPGASLQDWEYDIIEIVDANILAIWDLASEQPGDNIPQAGDDVKVCRWITAKSDEEGALQVSQGPIQYTRNGATQAVVQDTVTPANNRPLPAGLYFIKDGVIVPVNKDTGTPANTAAIPVEITGASGQTINITAGDIDIHTTSEGVNFDSMRIGDGSGIYLTIDANGKAMIHDEDIISALSAVYNEVQYSAVNTAATTTSVDNMAAIVSTAAKQDLAKAVLDNILTALGVTNAKDFSTSAKQDLAKTVLDNILTAIGVTNGKDFSTSSKQDLAKAVLDQIQTNTLAGATSANQSALATLTGAVTEAAPATDTASSGLNGRLQRIAQRITSLIGLFPTTIGQKANAASLAVSLSTEQDAKLDSIVSGVAARVIDSIGQSTTAGSATIAAPAGAKGFTIQNSTRASGALRFTKTGGGASASIGFLLEPGQSTSYQEGASSIDVFAVDASAIDAAIVWYK